MKLWTIQPVEIVDILESNGFFSCDTKLSENYDDFRDAYDWIIGEMDRRGIPHPVNVDLPLWAWHTREWQHKKPDFRTRGLGDRGRRYACIEFEIPDEEILLSDFGAWHLVLNKGWYSDSKNEKEWEKLNDWYDALPIEEQNRLMMESWQKIFDVEPQKKYMASKRAVYTGYILEINKQHGYRYKIFYC